MEIGKVTEKQIDKKKQTQIIARAGRIIREGGLVAFPTETVYGLGADALNPTAAAKIYEAKGRPSDNPLIVHVANFESVGKLVTEVPETARALAERFWPGPLTMILNKSQAVPKTTSGGLETVAVRMPSHRVALALIEAAGGYVAAPSANVSGRPSPTRAEHVIQDLDGRIDMVIDGGEVGIGLESTIVDLTGEVPVILRPGAITKAMLEECVGEVRIDEALRKADSTVRPKAPGMKYKHYAPRAEVTVFEGERSQVVRCINGRVRERLERLYRQEDGQKESVFEDFFSLDALEGRIGILCSDETLGEYPYGIAKSLGSLCSEEDIARHLYGVLREFDQTAVEVIYAESFYTRNMGGAIMNRLLKAAGHHRIHAEREMEEKEQ